MSFKETDLKILSEYSCNKSFIMETGGGEFSTTRLASIAKKYGSIFVSIEIDREISNKNRLVNVDYQNGWSTSYEDMIIKRNPDFIDLPKKKRKKYPWADRRVVTKGKKYMIGEKDLIRKSIEKYNLVPDFFFCDTGEFCGLAEWNIISKIQKVGSIFSCHDIYYPKSIKCFKIVKIIESSTNWKILKKTNTSQGLLIARKVFNV